MPPPGARAAALLTWVNSTKVCPDPLHDLTQLQDCRTFIKIIHKLHRSEDGESVLDQPLPERINFIRGFLQKHWKHKVAVENLVSAQELLEGEELALAKVTVLLLYHTSMSSRSPGDWNEFDYETQVELASILRFVLDNEENLSENLETFLQRKAPLPPPSASSSSEEHSPLLSVSHKREVRFLELQRIASSSGTNSMFSGPPSSPMGDVMQTPQFQLRRLKKQLAVERENRDELEVELAENRKLLTEKEAQINLMQQRIDRLTLLHENQTADQPEPKEVEELREKNESLMLRLHDALKQCQDLKTEKGQMDRKINQLSEENGDLSFKLREIASHMVQLQEALNELSEEHNAALAQSQEKQGQLESELHAALQEKKCSEEKIEILQGKISLLEDQLAKLGDRSAQEKGEVMSDILKLEDLKQEVSSLTTKGAELQATVLQLEEEKRQWEAALQSERGHFEEEKQQFGNLIASLQTSLSESHQVRERLEQDLQEAKQSQNVPMPSQEVEEVARQLEKTLLERDSALQQLQHLQEANASLSNQLQAMVQVQNATQATSAHEKAELTRKVTELEAKISEVGAVEGLRTQLQELESRLKESQQKLVEKDKLARENSRLQERLLFLEESLRNTEGILEDEKRRAAESLEVSLARITELEEEKKQLVQGEKHRMMEEKQMEASSAAQGEEGERGQLEEEMRTLRQEHSRACQLLQAEREKTTVLEARTVEHREKLLALQAELSNTQARVKEKEGEEQKLKAEVTSLQEKMAIMEQTAAQRVAGLEMDARRTTEALEVVSQQLSQEQLRSQELEATMERLRNVETELSQAATTSRQRELEQEVEVRKLSEEMTLLGSRLEETLREHRRDLARRDEEAERLQQEVERVKGDLAAERAHKAELEVQLQNFLNEQRVERLVHQEEVARSQQLVEEKERELEGLRQTNISQGEALEDLQKAVNELREELASAQAAKVGNEVTQSRDMDWDKATCSKEMSLKSLEEKTPHREQESSRDLYEEKLKETQALRSQVEELEKKCKEHQEAVATLEQAAAEAARVEQAELEASRREVAQHKEKTLELQKLLEASRSVQALHDGTVEALRKELQEKGREVIQSKATLATTEKELMSLRSVVQEKSRLEESWKEQVSQCVQEMERKNSLIGSLEHEVSILHRQMTEKEGESKELKRLIIAESEKSKKLEERLRVLQSEMATAASRAAERCSLMKVEVQRCQEEMEKQRLVIETLKRDRHCQSEREDELRQEVKVCQDKCIQKEQLLAALQQELGSTQALAGELPALKHLCQQLQAERASLENQHHQDVEEREKALAALQAELAQAKLEAAEMPPLRERSTEQEKTIKQLQAEAAEQAARVVTLQQANARLAEENRGLSESQSRGQQRLEEELGQVKEKHTRELERLRSASEELVATSRQEAEETKRKLEVMRKEYETTKAVALEEKTKMLEERQRLMAQVEQLEAFRKDQAKQMEELNKKLTQHEKTTRMQQQKVKALEAELQAETTRQQEKVAELETQLAQKEQAVEHYKGQMEKAKTHYDAKKQQNQELVEKLKAMEQLQKENVELRNESERLAKELQQSILQAKESELNCRNLSSQVHSLEAQVEFANQKLRDLGKFQVATDTLKSREVLHQNPADLSADSLDLSLNESQPLNSTRRPGRSHSETSTAPPDTKESQRLPRKVESLESLYFTPIPSRTRSQLESSAGSLGDLSLDSGCKTRSARRRTTINITMTKVSKKQTKAEEPDSANSSFYSVQPAQPHGVAPGKSRLRSATSTRSLASFSSQESLNRPETSSPQENPLLGLPGYRPVTRSSLRRMEGGSSSSLGRSSIYLGTCQDEPEPLDDWNRIAELQQRNRACPPHLKTCYPLESRPSNSLGTITDEEMKTGDPKETLRRASIQPSQIALSIATRSSTLATTWATGGITTRQQRKRLSDESHQGPDTPESKKPTSCFPRPQTPRDRGERRSSQFNRRSDQPGPTKQTERRQSMAFSILNTPKKLGSSLLRRAAARKNTPKNSPRTTTRRSPRIATTKSPRSKATLRGHKDTKF